MNKKQKRTLARIAGAAALFAATLFLPEAWTWPRLIIFLAAYGLAGWKVLWKAARNIAHGQVFDENFLMCVASVGAFLTGEFAEGTAVMLFYQIGEWFESVAVGKSRQSIAALMDIRPDTANVERDGEIIEVEPDEVPIGETIVIRPGERVPLDGIVLEGLSQLDTAALTGESVPRTVRAGDRILSGCINRTGVLRVQTDRAAEESTVARILALVEEAGEHKSKAESFITRFARWYTPLVCASALLLAVIPSLVTGNWSMWIHRALIFLVVSCPCALVISIPLSFFGGIGGASRSGILIKGGNHLEALSRVDTVVFDKTGTLTEGVFRVTAVHPNIMPQERLLMLTAHAEAQSNHPIARSICEAFTGEMKLAGVKEMEEIAGLGVRASVDGLRVAAGNEKLMALVGADIVPCEAHRHGTVVHIAVDGRYEGHIVISDEIKSDAAEAIRTLKQMGVKKTIMLTGDSRSAGEHVAQTLGIDEAHCALLPEDKVARVEALLKEGGTVAFVGDGLNDAPVLTRADIGIAMGALGSDAAIEAADVVLMKDKPSDIARAVRIARKTHGIVRQNIAFALTVKALVLTLGALGAVGMGAAVFGDVGVSVIAILNAMRALRQVKA